MTVVRKVSILAIVALFAMSTNVYGENNSLRWGVKNVAFKKATNKNDRPVITGISLHPTKSICSVVGDDHIVRIYSTEDRRVLHTLEGHNDWVRCSKIAKNGKVFSAGNDRQVLVWEQQADGKYTSKRVVKEDRAIAAIDVSPNGRYLATVGFSNKIYIYETESRNKVMTLDAPSKDMRTVKFSPTEQLLAAAGRNGIVRTYHMETGKSIRDYQPHKRRVRGLSFTLDGKKVITVGEDRLVAITTLSKVIKPSISTQLDYKLMSLAVINDEQFAIGGTDNLVQIWKIADLSKVGNLVGHTGTVAALDSMRSELISGGYDTRLRVWQTAPSVAKTDQTIQ